MAHVEDMAAFWDARAREDARYFVDTTVAYGGADEARFWAGGEEAVQRVLGDLGLTLGRDDVVADLGCGVGRLTRALAARAARVEAVDVSPEMLTRAQAANPQLQGRVAWHLGDGRTLPLPDACVDAVFSFVVLQHVPDPAIVLGYVAEMGRVLRPGGWAAFQVSDDPSIHRRPGLRRRVAGLLGRGPRGEDHPAWVGTAVPVAAVRTTAERAGLRVARVVGEGTQFCLVSAVRSPG